MGLIRITRHIPHTTLEGDDLFDVGRTIRYKYEPEDEEEAALEYEEWLAEPEAETAVRLIENNPLIFPHPQGILHPHQELYAFPPRASRFVRELGVAVTPRILQLILRHAPFASATSGGKDGGAAAAAENELLDFLGHTGPRKIIFSDVKRLDWHDSADSARRLADLLKQELIVVEMARGMIEQFVARWQRNLVRYRILKCVKLIKPWSSPGRGRFCTSAKLAPITQRLTQTFPNSTIVNCTGIRREESDDRLFAEVCAAQDNLRRVRLNTVGFDYHPVVHWREPHVLAYLESLGLKLPDSYRIYGMSRHSCKLCIMSSLLDLVRALSCPENIAVCLELIALEIASTFSFQPSRWLADVADQEGLLDQRTRMAVKESKERAAEREAAEETIPEELLFCEHWPRRPATRPEARLLAGVRRRVARIVNLGLPEGAEPFVIDYDTDETVEDRFQELFDEKERRDAARPPRAEKAPKKKRRKARTALVAAMTPQLSLLTDLHA